MIAPPPAPDTTGSVPVQQSVGTIPAHNQHLNRFGPKWVIVTRVNAVRFVSYTLHLNTAVINVQRASVCILSSCHPRDVRYERKHCVESVHSAVDLLTDQRLPHRLM